MTTMESVKRKTGGRPPKPEGQKRTKRLHVMVTKNEAEQIAANASAAGFPSVADYLRARGLILAQGVAIPPS